MVSKMNSVAEASTQRQVLLKQINKNLSLPRTRCEGINKLMKFLDVCSDDEFIEHCVSWMQHAIKSVNITEEGDMMCEALEKLLKMSSKFAELHKSVSNFVTTRFFDHFYKHLVKVNGGWVCLEQCLILYNAPCGMQKENLNLRLNSLAGSSLKIDAVVSKCFALLPCLGGGGTKGLSYRTCWKEQFLHILDKCHAIMNVLFTDIKELQEYTVQDGSYVNCGKHATELAVHLQNYLSVLSSMLLEYYPAVKLVPVEALMGLLCRGLAVTPQHAGIPATKEVLPQVHLAMLTTLQACVVSCRSHLLPFAHLICKFVRQTLDWTGRVESTYGTDKPTLELRTKTYEVLSNWLAVAHSGSGATSISKQFLSAVVSDLWHEQAAVVVQNSKGSSEQQAVTRKKCISEVANQRLCFAALKTLELFLRSVGCQLPAEDHKTLQQTIISTVVKVQKCLTHDSMVIPYSVTRCREALYAVLLALTMEPTPTWPPPTQFALAAFAKGQTDLAVSVAMFCTSALRTVELILHPEYSVAAFPPRVEDLTDKEKDRTVELTWRESMIEEEEEVNVEDESDENSRSSVHNENSASHGDVIMEENDAVVSEVPNPEKRIAVDKTESPMKDKVCNSVKVTAGEIPALDKGGPVEHPSPSKVTISGSYTSPDKTTATPSATSPLVATVTENNIAADRTPPKNTSLSQNTNAAELTPTNNASPAQNTNAAGSTPTNNASLSLNNNTAGSTPTNNASPAQNTNAAGSTPTNNASLSLNNNAAGSTPTKNASPAQNTNTVDPNNASPAENALSQATVNTAPEKGEIASALPVVLRKKMSASELTPQSVGKSIKRTSEETNTVNSKKRKSILSTPQKKYFLRSTADSESNASEEEQKLAEVEEESPGIVKDGEECDILNSFDDSVNPN